MIRLIPKYKKLQNKKRYTIVRGGRGAAKSFHVAAYLVNLTYKEGEVILYTRYTMTSAVKSIIPEFQEKIELMEVPHHFHISGNIITNKISGSKIIFSGIKTSSGNQTAALKSITGLTVWILDEAEEMVNQREFDKIDDSIRKVGGSNRVFLVFNTDMVDQQHWIYKRFFQSGDAEDTQYITATYLDNLQNLDPSFIAKAERIKEEDPEFYRINYLGEFPVLRDAVFTKQYTTYQDEPKDFDWQGIGGDFGFADNPTTAVLVTKNKNNLYLREIVYAHGLRNEEIAQGLNEEQKGLVNVWDSAEPKSISDLRIFGVNAYKADKGPGSVSFGIKQLQSLNIFIHKDSKNLQNEWISYKWKKKNDGDYLRDGTGNRIPIKANDHCIDAVRYILMKLHAWG